MEKHGDKTGNTGNNEEIEPSAVVENAGVVPPDKAEVDKDEEKLSMKQDAFSEKLAEAEARYKEVNDKYLRLYAEYDNFRRRTAKEKIDMIMSAGVDVVLSFLPVLDDLERALSHHKDKENDDDKSLIEGLEVICKKLKKVLDAKGIKEMEAQGVVFDPELHDALSNVQAPKHELKGKVLDVVEKGYMMNNKVIRHAKVVVGS
jgi:molecular chaperone GrpE